MKIHSVCITFLMLICFIFQTEQAYTIQNSPLLLYSTTKDIRIVNATRGASNKIKTTVIVKNYTYIPAVDYHYEKKKICWADDDLESIHCITYDNGEAKDKVKIISGVSSVDGLACDWFTDKIYWTDSDTKRIEVATLEGTYRKVLFWTDIDQPRDIALVPMKGLLFWTDWGDNPKIERAGMNGDPKTRKVIVSEGIFWPNGISVDYESELVYWIDGKLLFIKVMDYEGKNITTLVSTGFEYPFALTHFHTKLFWTDWKSMSINYYDTNSTQKPIELIHLPDLDPMDIHVWNEERQPKQPHPCEKNNGNCSHLCLLSPDPPGYTCACPMGIKLLNDSHCFMEPQELLLIARRRDIFLVYLDSPEYSNKILPLEDVKYSIAVDFDPVDQLIYWSDDEVKKIQRARLNGSNQENVISTGIEDPDGIAVDWVSRNIYWADTGTDRIEVATLDGKYRRVVIMDGLVDPRGIAVASELGWLFWSDWNEKDPKVERSNLDGTERQIIVSDELGWPNGITLDLDNMKIYWCDAMSDRIEYANMDGSDRRELINDDLPHVFGFSLMGEYLYWTDWQRRAIDRAHKETGGQREVIVDQVANVMGLKAIRLGRSTGSNPCKKNNGNCSQICLYRHNKTRICACEIDYELTIDKQTCVKPKAFLLYTKKDNIGRIGIENQHNDTIPISGIKQASSVDFDINTMRIYWSDTKLRTIMRAYINGSDPERVIELGLASPESIAVDWLGLNIYWTDPAAHRIEVSRLVGSSRRTLLWDELYEPHSIVLDPLAGYMYWSEWGTTNAIKKAAMDGTGQRKLTTTNGHATSLSLDYTRRRLYWIELEVGAILNSDLDGNDKNVILKQDNRRPVGLSLYREYIYWSDEVTGEILRTAKADSLNHVVIHNSTEAVTDLQVYYAAKQNQSNQCTTSNGGCTHLCLALPADGPEDPMKFTCACPTHYTLQNNECVAPTNFMIYSQKNLAVRVVLDTHDCPEAVLPIQGLKTVKAIDFDPKHNTLYWIEGKSHSIKRSEINGSQSVVLPGNSDLHPFDLVVDSVGSLLFWTCAVQNIINVTCLDKLTPCGNLEKKDDEKPRLLAVHLTKRLLFYTDVGSTPKLIRIRLDGSHRLVITTAPEIAAIAVDTENDLIVWAQGHSIYISNIDGENQHVLLNESNSRITQLTIHLGWLYWIDKELHQLQRLELKLGKSRSTLAIQASHILDLISVKKPETEHSCLSKRCSHFCILNGTSPMCACPSGKALQEDKKSCVTQPNCGKDRFTCAVTVLNKKDCIPIAWRCDKQTDCRDGSDELDCPSCLPDQFRCQDGECIDSAHVCDNFAHCGDRSDEKNCCKSGFQCPQTEVCLPHSVVCDGNENCADGSDEDHVLCSTLARPNKRSTNTIVLVVLGVVFVFSAFSSIFYCQRKKFPSSDDVTDHSEGSSSPMHPNSQGKNKKLRKGIPDVVRMSMVNDNLISASDKRYITGASSSSNTNGSSGAGYPRETLNPPPSPATTAASTRNSSPSSRYRPYRHYRSINQPPPPTPCSTDVCDESDYNYSVRGRYDAGPFPPPPTPRSHCQNESCPPSPSSRSSTYFSPLPPPPSPVASPRGGYDS